MLTREVDKQLLTLARMQIALEQACGIWTGSRLEDRGRPADERRALARIHDLDRLAALLQLDQIVIVAVSHHGALAERELLRRIGRGLHLHDALLGELLQIRPAKIARDLGWRRDDRARVGRMTLHHLAGPF